MRSPPRTRNNSQSSRTRSRTPATPQGSVAKKAKLTRSATKSPASKPPSGTVASRLSRRRSEKIPTSAIILAEKSSEEENEVTPDVRETKHKSIKIRLPKVQNSQSVQTPKSPKSNTRKSTRVQSKSKVEEVELKTPTTLKTESRTPQRKPSAIKARKPSAEVEAETDSITPRRKSGRKLNAVVEPEPVKTQTPSTSTSTSKAKSKSAQATPKGIKPLENGGVEVKQLEWKFSVYGIPKCPLPCRETQFEEVWKFLFENVTEKNSGCMYVSGVPGTGKTVIVQSVIDTMRKESEGKGNKKTLDFKYLYINGLTLASPDKIWKRMFKGFELQNKSKGISTKEALKRLDSFFEGHQRIPVVLVVDELDQILDKQQTILYQLLEWSSHAKNMFSFVAIFNTMSLPEHGLAMRNYSRMGFKRSVFPPYNKDQLQTIVMNMLAAFKTKRLTEECVSLLSRKVAAISGDARRALEIARRTLEIADSENFTGIQAVSNAFKEIFSSAKIETIKYTSLLEQLVLRAICDEIRCSGVEEVLTGKIYENVTTQATFQGMQWEKDAILKALLRLAVMRLVIVEDNTASLHKRVLLKVPVEDVNFALGLHNTDTDGQ